MLAPGVRFDRYEIEALLGEGGMGRVYLARDTRLGRKVALKVLHKAFTEGDGPARLLREARAAAALDHPNAIAIFDVGEADGVAYLAMEYLDGRSLRECVGDTTIPIVQRIRWLADIARALAAAHARGLVHRDIKPANVMVRADGSLKVLDFGIARQSRTTDSLGATAREVAERADTFTGPGMVVGTPDYMAPEQMLSKPVDGRSDQFAWGVTAYELLTGSRPWTDSSDFVRLVAEVVCPDPVPTLMGKPEVSRAVAEVVDRALRKDPAERHASMLEIVKALDAVTSVRRSLPPPRRRRVAVAALLGAVGATALLGSGLALKQHHGERGSSMASSSSSARSTGAAAVPTSMVDLPLPPSTRPDALLALRRARQDLHDGSIYRGSVELRTASRLDASLVTSLITLLAWDVWQSLVDPHASFTSAHQLRASLSDRDRGLVDALAPVYGTDLSDVPAAVTKLVELAARFPGDSELQLITGYWLAKADRTADANAALERAMLLDPSFAGADWVLARFTTDPQLQEKYVDECIGRSPAAASCVRSLASMRQEAGDCAAMEVLANKLVAIEPDFEWSYVYVLNAIVARGAGRAETQPVLKAITDSLRAQARADGKPDGADSVWPALVAFHYGAFDEGTKLLSRLPDDPRGWLSLQTALESGDARAAATEARAYATRRGMLSEGSATTDAVALRVLRDVAHEPPAAVAALSAKWGEQDARFDGAAWAPVDAFILRAGLAVTPEGARDAVAGVNAKLLADVIAYPMNTLTTNLIVGQALSLAGRLDDALPLLSSASNACGLAQSESSFTFARVEAQKDLADLLAKKGDTAGACGWLGKIVAQWGRATPRSVTAEAARAERKALSCRN